MELRLLLLTRTGNIWRTHTVRSLIQRGTLLFQTRFFDLFGDSTSQSSLFIVPRLKGDLHHLNTSGDGISGEGDKQHI